MRKSLSLASVILLTISLGRMSVGQTKPAAIQPGDLLEVGIESLVGRGAEEKFDVRVDDEGKISLPYIRRIELKGKSNADAAKAIGAAYTDKGYLKNPKVQVTQIDEPADKKIKPAPIAVGETVKIRVWDLQQIGKAREFQPGILEDGTVDLPVIGKLKLAGLKEFEAEDAIARQCETGGWLKNAMVTVRRIAPAGK